MKYKNYSCEDHPYITLRLVDLESISTSQLRGYKADQAVFDVP